MINAQITKQIKKAKAVLCTLLRFKSLKTKFKMQLIKTLVMPYLYYPPIPLHLASKNQMRRLQRVQNDSLRFAFDISWDDFVSNKKLHTVFKDTIFKETLRPVNQELYWRARKTWTSIKDHGSGDSEMLQKILDLQIDGNRKSNDLLKYPSSYTRCMDYPEPAPLYG